MPTPGSTTPEVVAYRNLRTVFPPAAGSPGEAAGSSAVAHALRIGVGRIADATCRDLLRDVPLRLCRRSGDGGVAPPSPKNYDNGTVTVAWRTVLLPLASVAEYVTV